MNTTGRRIGTLGVNNSNELYHFGIKGQKWGVRRFQNDDGSLTSAGVERYSTNTKAAQRRLNKLDKKQSKAYADFMENYSRASAYQKRGKSEKEKKYAERGDKALVQYKKYEQSKRQVLDLLKKNGRNVKTKDVMRFPTDVKAIVGASAMATAVGLINPMGFGFGAIKSYRPSVVRGTKYKVE